MSELFIKHSLCRCPALGVLSKRIREFWLHNHFAVIVELLACASRSILMALLIMHIIVHIWKYYDLFQAK